MANRSDREPGHPAGCPGRHSPQSRVGPSSRIPSGPAVNMNDCIDRPDTRLHPTNASEAQFATCNAGAIHTRPAPFGQITSRRVAIRCRSGHSVWRPTKSYTSGQITPESGSVFCRCPSSDEPIAAAQLNATAPRGAAVLAGCRGRHPSRFDEFDLIRRQRTPPVERFRLADDPRSTHSQAFGDPGPFGPVGRGHHRVVAWQAPLSSVRFQRQATRRQMPLDRLVRLAVLEADLRLVPNRRSDLGRCNPSASRHGRLIGSLKAGEGRSHRRNQCRHLQGCDAIVRHIRRH